jgi:hypothetical protein
MKYKRYADESRTITSPNGTAVISRTPDANVEEARPWTLEINGTFQDTYDTEEEAISAAKEILAVKQ